MANKVAAPYGFTPFRHVSGGCITMSEYPIKDTYTTKIYNGDPVEIDTDAGYLNLAGADDAEVVGIFMGVMFVNSKGEQVFSPYWDGVAGSSEIKAIVVDDPNVTFKVQKSTATTAATVGTAVGNLAGTGMLDSIGRSTAKVGDAATQNIWTIRSIINDPRNVSDDNLNLDVEVVCTGMTASS